MSDLSSINDYFLLLKNSHRKIKQIERLIEKQENEKVRTSIKIAFPLASSILTIGTGFIIGNLFGAHAGFTYGFCAAIPVACVSLCAQYGTRYAVKSCHEKKQLSNGKQLSSLLRFLNEEAGKKSQVVVVEIVDEKASLILPPSEPTSVYGFGSHLSFLSEKIKQITQSTNDETIIEMEDKSEHLYQAAASGL